MFRSSATKKLFSLFAVLLIASAYFLAPAERSASLATLLSVSASTQQVGTVTASALNVRKGAGTSYGILGAVYKGSKHTILASKKVSGVTWYKIQFKSTQVWVSGQYLSVKAVTAATTTASSTTAATTSTTAVTTSTTARAETSQSDIASTTSASGVTITTTTTTAATTSGTQQVGTVTASALNVRKGAGTSYSILGAVYKGSKHTILASKKVSGVTWYKIQFKSTQGWVSGQYLSVRAVTAATTTASSTTAATTSTTAVTTSTTARAETSQSDIASTTTASGVTTITTTTTAATTSGTQQVGTVTASALNVRKGAGTSYGILGAVYKGSKHTILASKMVSGVTWYKIQFKSTQGWVSGQYLSVSTSSASPTTPTKPNSKYAYLTFDDGPSKNTEKILDILDEYNVKATFFVVYKSGMSSRYKAIVERGHTIALHSYSHSYSSIYKSEKAYFADLEKLSSYIETTTGVKSKILRFPGGSSNTVSNKYSRGIMNKLVNSVTEKGYIYHDWNVDSTDASGTNIAKSKLISRVKSSVNGIKDNRSIDILMHDTGSGKNTTVEALPDIIKFLKSKGYTLLPITEDTKPVQHIKPSK